MKLTFFLMLLGLMSFASITYSQATKLSFESKNATIESVFEQIESLSEFKFAYNSKKLDVDQKISLKVENQTIDAVLDRILKSANFQYRIVDRYIIITDGSTQDPILQETGQVVQKVTGKVTDSAGQPLPGVAVVVKGTTVGIVTDSEGNFNLPKVEENTTLMFSFVGMQTKEVNVRGRLNMNVVMQEVNIGIDEVVVVAYGTQKESHLTTSVDQIKSEELENRPLRSVADGLSGLAAGVNVRIPSGAPNATPQINLRGFTGFSTDSNGNIVTNMGSPLILVDGVERRIQDVNANDIESVSVLKDGAATAIYGSRAPDGIILVTTKSGKKNSKMTLQYSANLRVAAVRNPLEKVDGYQWAQLIGEQAMTEGWPGYIYGEQYLRGLVGHTWALYNKKYDDPVFDGFTQQEIEQGMVRYTDKTWSWPTWNINNDLIKDHVFRKNVPSQQHNVSISGGGDNTSYFAGLGYNGVDGILKGPNFNDRYSALLKMNSDITKWLNVDLSMNYVRTEIGGVLASNGSALDYNNVFSNYANAWFVNPTYTPIGGFNQNGNIVPIVDGFAGNNRQNTDDYTFSGKTVIEPIKNLKLSGRYVWRNEGYRNYSNRFIVYATLPDGTLAKAESSPGSTGVGRTHAQLDYHTIDANISYQKVLMERHNFSVLAGYQEEENFHFGTGISADNLITTSLPSISTSYKNNLAANDNGQLYAWATQGLYGRVGYNFAERYFVEFNIRRDATSRFSKDSRWGSFPSVSGAWNVANEKFWFLKETISQFKPRFSWSTSGNSLSAGSSNYYAYTSPLSLNTNPDIGLLLNGQPSTSVTSPDRLVSQTLTWAKPTNLDFGVDIMALKNRLKVKYDWYQRTIRDQVGPAETYPATLGIGAPRTNNTVTQTRGWEFSVNWRDEAFKLMGKPVNYDVNFFISDYIGYVLEYKSDKTGKMSGTWTPGEKFGQNRLYQSNGLYQSVDDIYHQVPISHPQAYLPGDLAYADIDGDGQINDNGYWYSMGDARLTDTYNYPRKTYSVNMGFNWNNFDVSILLNGVGQWDVFTASNFVRGTDGGSFSSPFFKQTLDLDYWRPNTPDGFFPRLRTIDTSWKANDQYALDLSHLRVQNVKIGYTLPNQWIERIGLKKCYVYFSGENLGFIYYNSYINIDPELLNNGGNGYPPQRILSFGLNINI